MQIVREIENFKPEAKPIYLALGNFDGLHKGHQKLISEAVTAARDGDGIAAAFVFEPHPIKVLFPERAPKLLVTAQHKAELMEKLGLDLLIYNSFTLAISKCSPEEFVQHILIEKLNIKQAFVGFNYTFGYRGVGTPELLQELGKNHGFGVKVISPVEVDCKVVSSSLIRKALEAGDIKQARSMLGYDPMLEGHVIEGERRGRTIGFPTANLAVSSELNVPGKGVYAARAQIQERIFQAVVNIGSKPTFHEEYPVSIEAHLIDFHEDIYGEKMRLYFIDKIRDERRFNNVEELVGQISRDRDKAKQIAAGQ
ncbi:MAG TPA: bifunctional riboflavin kinase/FAD synthetase [Syntrophomonas sp.]|jgi:riboflavin kinase/FMN adenylyltransferase|nr:bifunctional riboflavin kinase/FAD synthetase [Syntrophomonas sp.]